MLVTIVSAQLPKVELPSCFVSSPQGVTGRQEAVIDESKDKARVDGSADWIELVITLDFYFWEKQTDS